MANKSLGTFTVGFEVNSVKFQDGLAKIQIQAKGFSKNVKSSFADAALGFKTFVAAFAASETVKYLNDVQRTMQSLQGVAKATGRSFGDIKETYERVFANMPVSAEQAAASIAAIAKSTKLTGEAFEKASLQVAAYQKLIGGDAKGFTRTAVGGMSRYNLPEGAFNDYTNLLYTVSNQTGAGFDKLNEDMSKGATELRNIGFSAKESAVFLGLLEQKGYEVDTVISAMRKGYDNLAKVPNIQNLPKFFKDSATYLSQMAEGTEKAKLSEVFGKNADDFLSAWKNVYGQVAATKEEVNKAFADMTKGAQNQMTEWDRLTQKAKAFGESFASIINPAIDVFYKKTKEALEPWNDFFKKISEDIKAATAPPVQLGIGALRVPLPPQPGASKPQYHVENGKFVKSAFTVSYQSAQEYMDSMERFKLLDEADKKQKEMATSTHEVAQAAQEAGKSVENYQAALDKAAASTTATVAKAQSLKDTMKDVFGDGKTNSDILTEATRNMANDMTNSFDEIIFRSKSVGQAFRDLAQTIIEQISKMLIYESISKPLATGIGSIFGSLFGLQLGSGGNSAANSLATATGNKRASGGPVSGGSPYLVGEQGPELFIPGMSGSIIPHNTLAGGGGIVVNQSFTLSGNTNQDLQNTMRAMIAQAKEAIASTVADVARRGGRASSLIRNAT
jgi:hypothetical protein